MGVEFYPATVEIKLENILSKPLKTSIKDRYIIAGIDYPKYIEDLAARRSLY